MKISRSLYKKLYSIEYPYQFESRFENCLQSIKTNTPQGLELYNTLAGLKNLDALKSFLDEVEIKTTRPKKLDLYKYVGREKFRPVLTGIFYDSNEKTAVATDGFILISSPDFYDENHAGQIVNKNGKIINETFPKWRLTIPTNLENSCPIKDVPAGVEQKVLKSPDEGTSFISFCGLYFSYNRYLQAVTAAKLLGLDTFKYVNKEDVRPTLFTSANSKSVVLLMPTFDPGYTDESQIYNI